MFLAIEYLQCFLSVEMNYMRLLELNPTLLRLKCRAFVELDCTMHEDVQPLVCLRYTGMQAYSNRFREPNNSKGYTPIFLAISINIEVSSHNS